MIRYATDNDLPIIMDIGNRAWQGIYDMYEETYGPDLFQRLTPDRSQGKGKQVMRHFQEYPETVLVCEEDGKVVGFVTFFIDEESGIGEIGNNAVDPECGVRGVGQQMYRKVMETFKETGLSFARVSTGLDDAHARARRAYERAGFDISSSDITYFKKL